jgi:putative hemolysin
MADLWQLALVFVLVVVNAMFAGSEIALISLRPAQLDRIEKRGGSGRVLARLARDPNRFLATIQIAITLAGFLASATAAVSLAEPVKPLFAPFGGAASVMSVMSVTLILTFFTLVFGELAPKRIAMQHPEGWALIVARPLDFVATVSRPAVWLLSVSTNLVVRLSGSDPTRQREETTEEELRDMIASQHSFTPEEREIIAGALEVGDRSLRQVLVPRHAIFALPAEMTVAEALPEIIASAHSRVPIYRTDLDSIVAVVQLRPLIGVEGTLEQYATPVLSFPESASVLSALATMQRERQQMALVVDEYGGLEGIVTMEDLVEEIVGEIYDEFDRDIEEAIRASDGSFELIGSFPVHDLIDLGIEVPEGPYATVAGLVLERLGHLPIAGETVEVNRWKFAVAEVTASSITRVHVRRGAAHAADDALAVLAPDGGRPGALDD